MIFQMLLICFVSTVVTFISHFVFLFLMMMMVQIEWNARAFVQVYTPKVAKWIWLKKWSTDWATVRTWFFTNLFIQSNNKWTQFSIDIFGFGNWALCQRLTIVRVKHWTKSKWWFLFVCFRLQFRNEKKMIMAWLGDMSSPQNNSNAITTERKWDVLNEVIYRTNLSWSFVAKLLWKWRPTAYTTIRMPPAPFGELLYLSFWFDKSEVAECLSIRTYHCDQYTWCPDIQEMRSVFFLYIQPNVGWFPITQ